MEITALQSVRIFGWWAQPRLTLGWEDVKRTGLSWNDLRQLDITADDLKLLQPDKMEWIQRGGVRGEDLRDLKVFPVNPIIDFRADLAELWRLAFTAQELADMQVNISQLFERGLSPSIMYYFNYELSDWLQLGLSSYHVSQWTEPECKKVFKLQKSEICKIIDEFKARN